MNCPPSFWSDAMHRRDGFTLIELLLVVAILAVMAGLALAGVQKARAAAQRAACLNNLRNLGVALHGYHDARGAFPPARVLGPFPPLEVPANVEHSWVPFILPFLEQGVQGAQYQFGVNFSDAANTSIIRQRLPVMQCPAAPQRDLDTFNGVSTAPGDYVPIMRVDQVLVALGLIDPVKDYSGVMGSNQLTRAEEIRDGQGYTLLLAEAAGRPQLWRAGKQEQAGCAAPAGAIPETPSAFTAAPGTGRWAQGPAPSTAPTTAKSMPSTVAAPTCSSPTAPPVSWSPRRRCGLWRGSSPKPVARRCRPATTEKDPSRA
jgi:prepilin-type N-terminal cleavage/methylation domain-containing protein